MKKSVIFVLAALVLAGGCSKKKGGGAKLKTDTDSVAYIIGMNVGMNLIKMDSTMNINAVCDGIRDVFAQAAKLTPEEAQAYYLRYVNVSKPQKVRALEEQFLEDIRSSNRNYARTSSGVTYTVETLGDQDQIPSSDYDSVAVRYLIRTADGKDVYSSYQRKDTLRISLARMLPGMRESVKLIGRGGKITAWMPSATAYGAEGNASLGIAPNATLYYEIELVGVDKYSNRRR